MVRHAPVYANNHIVDDGVHSVAPETLHRPVHPEREKSWRGRPRVAKDDSDLTLRTAASNRSLVDASSGREGARMERHKSFCMRHHIDGLAAEESESRKKKGHRFHVGKRRGDNVNDDDTSAPPTSLSKPDQTSPEKSPTAAGNRIKSKFKGAVRAHMLAQSLGHSKQSKAEAHSKMNDLLLRDIFPPHIADALREGRKVEQETHECVTIFFSDIVGYSAISRDLTPDGVADMLDRLYSRFDELTRLHDIFKMETIGDAYMAVANLVKDQSVSHVRRIAEFAIDAIKVANRTQIDREDPSKGCVEIRVGFHSGPVTSGVVGTRLPKYGIFGDSVNTASRMESNSEPNRILISDVSARLLAKQAPGMPIVSRGIIDVKGIGQMSTFWVNHRENQSVQVPFGLDMSDHSVPSEYRGRRRSSHDDHQSRSRGESSLSSHHHSSKSRSTSGHGGRRSIGTKQVSGKFRHESSLGDEAMHKKPAELKSLADPRSRRESSFAAGPMFRSSVAISLSEPIPGEDKVDDEQSVTEKEGTRETHRGDLSLATVDLDGEESRLRRAISDVSIDDPVEIHVQEMPGPRRSSSDPSLNVDSQFPRRPPRAIPRNSELSRFSGLTKDSSFRSTNTRHSMKVAIRRGRETALTPSRELPRHESSRLSKLEQEGRGINIDRRQRLRHIDEMERRVTASGCGDVVFMEEKATAAEGGHVYTKQSQLVPNEVSPNNDVEANPLGMHIREVGREHRRLSRMNSSRSESAMKRALKAGQRQIEKERYLEQHNHE